MHSQVHRGRRYRIPDMAAYTDITGLGRPPDLRLNSNRIALGGSALAFGALLVWFLITDDGSFIESGFAAGFAAVSVFLGWAISRELDPDRADAAAVAMALTFVFVFVEPPSALASGVALLAIRLVAGTVGVALRPVDLAVLAGLTGLAAATPSLWVFGAAFAIYAWSAPELEAQRTPARIAVIVGAVGGLGVAAWITWFGDGFDVDITRDAYVLAAIAGAAMLLSVRRLDVVSATDAGTGVVSGERIRLARIVAGAGLMWAAVFGGVAAFWALGPVAAALVVAAIYRVFVHPA